MIGYLSGVLLDRVDSVLTVGVGEVNTGIVGYRVSTPQRVEYQSIPSGSKIALFLHTHVREDALDLYGFTSPEEKELFLSLLQVQNVGPKLAITVLSNADPASLIHAILDEDAASLTRIPGVGKKTAERLLLDLKDSLKKKKEAGKLAKFLNSSIGSGGSTGARSGSGSIPIEILQDARDALLGLGYKEAQIDSLLQSLAMDAPGNINTQSLIKMALRSISLGGSLG